MYKKKNKLAGLFAALFVALLLVGCQTNFSQSSSSGRQQDRGPDQIPPGVLAQPDPVPRDEPLSASGNSLSYVVFGKRYHRLGSARGFAESGVASWYGEKFHGRLTASGEPYNMYAMTAAHKSIPLPTYVRVTNIENNRSIVVRVNDRGPFVGDRLIDLSYAAAAKLDMLAKGTARVRVVSLSGVPGETGIEIQTAQGVLPADKPAADKPVKETPAPLPYKIPQPILSGPTVATSEASTTAVQTSDPQGLGTTLAQRVAVLSSGQYLQLGAFGSFEAAGDLLGRVRESLAVEVFVARQSDSELYRVQAGPFESTAMLSAAQLLLLQNHAIKAIPLQRPDAGTRCC